jgi:two-component system sensor histidine kinase RegB
MVMQGMAEITPITADLRGRARSGWVRLETLTMLRWLAVCGQTSALLVAYYLFSVSLPLALCGLVVVASIVFNIASIQIYPSSTRLSERASMASMLFDLAQVSLLLFLTGGLANPFAALLLAPVTISATALRLRSTIIVSSSALAAIAVLAVWRQPLIFANGNVLEPPPIYVFGVWASLTIAAVFMAVYARRVTVETYRMSKALSVAEEALSREQRLTAIGGLAAAAAHELGTPLATIKLVSGELVDELGDKPELLEDAQLIRDQADRCGEILSELSRGGKADAHVKTVPISSLIEEAAAPHAGRGKRIIIRLGGVPIEEAGEEPIIVHRLPEVVHGLRNLVQNAVEFANQTIWVDISQTGRNLRLTVGDDGPGYPEDMLERLGDPYVKSSLRVAPPEEGGGEYKGMGLGVFIAKTLLERTGARVSFANSASNHRRLNEVAPVELHRPIGAVAAVVWPIDTISPADKNRGALGQNPDFSLNNI